MSYHLSNVSSSGSKVKSNSFDKQIIKRSECSMIIRDLSFFCNESHLSSLVCCYGECVKVHVCRSEETNHRSLLHAFIEMMNEEAVIQIIEELNGVLFMGRQLKYNICPFLL
jgi:RNA recognition motif-containing protein